MIPSDQRNDMMKAIMLTCERMPEMQFVELRFFLYFTDSLPSSAT